MKLKKVVLVKFTFNIIKFVKLKATKQHYIYYFYLLPFYMQLT